MDTKDSTDTIYTFSSFSVKKLNHKIGSAKCNLEVASLFTMKFCWNAKPGSFNLVVKRVKCVSSYLVCVRFGFSDQIEAWCGVGVSFLVGELLPKLSQAALDPRRTEGPSYVSWY